MYRRSYDYTITPEQREMFIKSKLYRVGELGYDIAVNDYPYDMCRDKRVKTEHHTMFFYEYSNVIDQIKEYIDKGYTVQINSSNNQSIPEIQHLHFIKVIE